MADGSLESVWARIEGGASAVQVGNFQLEEEIAELKASESVDAELEAMKAALKAKGK